MLPGSTGNDLSVNGEPFAPATAVAAAISAGRTTSRAVLEAYLDRVDRHNGSVNAVVTLDAEAAFAAADDADRAVRDGRPLGPLHGVPMTVKDSFETAGLRTTAGSEERRDNVPDGDAAAVARLKAAGAIVFGKTNVPEDATGQETANTLFGRTNNPWDLSRTPGASSGGAAAALAAGLTALELGSDLGGSIRQPSHYCGTFGHYPTHGLVPPRGQLPSIERDDIGHHEDLLAIGPMARSADDLEVALLVLAGPEERGLPAWRLELPPPRNAALSDYRIAAWLDDPACPVDDEVGACLEAAADALERAGATVDREARPELDTAEAEEVAFALWVSTMASSATAADLARYRTALTTVDPDDESRGARRLRATVQTHGEWLQLDERRRRLSRSWDSLLDRFDVVLCPVTPVVAIPHDPHPDLVDSIDHRLERTIVVNGQDRPYLDQVVWNILVGMARLPSTVAPVGIARSGLPVGVQIVGPRYGDRTTIDVARKLSEVTGGFRPPPGFV